MWIFKEELAEKMCLFSAWAITVLLGIAIAVYQRVSVVVTTGGNFYARKADITLAPLLRTVMFLAVAVSLILAVYNILKLRIFNTESDAVKDQNSIPQA